MKLSIVIIGRNEAQHIEKCIRSIYKGTESFDNKEILYVDSASTDDTLDLARRFPIRIVQLRSQWPLSASAGRYIGTHLTKGDYIFFIDGDTLLYRSWMKNAVSFLESNEDVAGVAGMVHELLEDRNGKVIGHIWNRYNQKSDQEKVSTFGGIALYRRSVLEKTGTFNPYLTVDEERELAYRIQDQRFQLIRFITPMAITYGPPRDSMKEVFRRSKANLFKYGITLKYCLSQGFFFKYLMERLRFVVFFLAGLLSFVFLILILFAFGFARFLPFVFAGTLIGMIVFKKGNIKSAFLSLVKRFIYTFQTIYSFITTKVNTYDMYPRDVIEIQ